MARKVLLFAIAFVLFCMLLPSSLLADTYNSPLFLDYTVTPLGGGVFEYNFTLILDNSDNSWVPGLDFNWIMFGTLACAGGCSTPLTDFVGDPSILQVGPFNDHSAHTYFTLSGGPLGENVPTLFDSADNWKGWIPTAVGDELTWSGTSTADLPIGELYWTYLFSGGVNFPPQEGATLGEGYVSFIAGTHSLAPPDQQIPAQYVPPVPEPSSLLLLGTGLSGLAGVIRRKLRA